MRPLTLLIKPAAGLCNMNCRYCFYKSVSAGRENRIMQYDTVDQLVRKLQDFRPSALSVLFQGGEPLLAGLSFYRYFVNAISRNLTAPVSYALQTNGLLIDDAFAAFFSERKILIGLSLDGDRATNDRCRLDLNGQSVFDRVLTAAETLRKHNVEFNILSVIDNENARAIANTYSFFREMGFSFLQFIPLVGEENGVSLSADQYETFLKTSFDLWYQDYINETYVSIRQIDNYIGILLGHPPESCAMRGVCGSYFTVEANGDLYPCDFYCGTADRIGTIFDEHPFEINDKHRAFIEESQRIHAHCRDCPYHFLCRGGCKTERINGYTENKYCSAYSHFFAYAAERMKAVAGRLL